MDSKLVETMNQYKFYHVMEIAPGVVTPGHRRYVPIQAMVMRQLEMLSLSGKRLLDIGCRDGLFMFAAERQGCAEVVGIDNDLSLAATEFLIPHLESNVRMVLLNVYDLDPEELGSFDIVIFAGVLYHLRYPFWALRRIREVLNDEAIVIIETATWNRNNRQPLLFCPTGDESPYEPTSCTFFNFAGLRDTLQSMGLRIMDYEHLSQQRSLKVAARMLGSRREAAKLHKQVVKDQRSQHIDRTVLLCKADASLRDEAVLQYWDGVHTRHSKKGG
jgi:2-polyprenyl-3-methyl-5-hydroxy-6-metoxy-1,4-benzoquinol methylase